MWAGAALWVSIVGICGPNKTFLSWGGPAGIGPEVSFGRSLGNLKQAMFRAL